MADSEIIADSDEKEESCVFGLLLSDVATKSAEKSISWYTQRPGFFVPFKSVVDVGSAVVFPIALPIILGVLGVVSGIIAVISAALCAGSFLFFKVISYFSSDIADSASDFTMSAGMVSTATAVASILLAISALIAAPITAVQLITRTGATIADQFGCCQSEGEEEITYSCT